MLIDLNVHSFHSRQGVLDPEEIILRAKQIGLDGLGFVEDQPWQGWRELKQLGELHGVAVFVGRELVSSCGHHLAYFPDPEKVEAILFPESQGEDGVIPFEHLVQTVRKAGGMLIAAHPYHLKIDHPSGDRLFTVEGLGAVEVRNGGCDPLVNDFALEASYHLKLPGVGGSGTRKTLDTLGAAATLFRTPVSDEGELIAAIRASDVWPIELRDDIPLRDGAGGGSPDRRGEPPRGRGDRDRGGDRRRDRRGGDRRTGGRRPDRSGSGRDRRR